MKIKPIIIIAGDQKSIFFEIFFKSLNLQRYKSPLILICSEKILKKEIKRYNFKKKFRKINLKYLSSDKLDNKKINLIDVNFQKTNKKNNQHIISQKYIKNCFNIAFNLIKKGISNKLINGPINKKKFFNKKYLGVTEYIANEFNKKKFAMLIYNKNLSVCPLSTHLPLKKVPKAITQIKIKEKVILLNNFFMKYFKFKPKIGVTGLNPHCESILKFNEDEKIIKPTIKILKKKGYNIYGPFPADTIFLKDNRSNFDVILGMYHDQVLTPIKTLFEYDAINITLGLSFLRISPDHGPNEKMVGKNLSNPTSLIKALKFLDQK